LAKLVGAVRRGLPLPLAGLVNARSLVGIDNLSGAVATCLGHGQAGGRTFLVADGPPVSTPELIELLAEAIGRPARLVPAPTKLLAAAGRALGRRDDLDRLLGSLAVDDAAIRRTLGWRSAVTLQDGLARMVRGL
jgi:nucleoside-diphosphate-sugar epimerase